MLNKYFNKKNIEESEDNIINKDNIIIEKAEYPLSRNNISYIIKVCKTRSKIILISDNYELKLNLMN